MSLTKRLRTNVGNDGGSIVLLGMPGAGTTTQARLLAARFNMYPVGTGDLVRTVQEQGGPLARQFENIQAEGDLVPDNLVYPLLTEAIAGHPEGIVLDGFPRTIEQAKTLVYMVPNVRRVVLLDLATPMAFQRVVARNRDRYDTGELFHKRSLRFFKEFEPIREYYSDRRLLSMVTADRDEEDVTEQIVDVVSNRTLYPASNEPRRHAR